MRTAGWVFMLASWTVVLCWTLWCFWRVLTSRRHWTRPKEDIQELHHGEFGEK